MQKAFLIDCELNYQVLAPSTFVFKIEAARCPEQTIQTESLTVVPDIALERHVDDLGTRILRVNCLPGDLSIRYRAEVLVDRSDCTTPRTEVPVSELPLEVLPFLTGSRYVESEEIFQDAVRWIGTSQSGTRRVERICQWVKDNVTYAIGTSMPYGTVLDVLVSRTGVCRDYAHVAIGFCRALNIPARFVVGHVAWNEPPPDFHALFEAWLGGEWVMFDPTGMADPRDVIRIGHGQDAAALPFATIFGAAQMTRMSPLVFRNSEAL